MNQGDTTSQEKPGPSDVPRLGELESRVMELVWDRGGWSTPGEVLAILQEERDLAYTTVMTILVRLWQKGLLERRKDGRAYAYHPTATREEWTARVMGDLLGIADNRAEALVHFVDGMDADDRAQLRRVLRIER
jgi:predicted transcriptional regulator